MKGTTGDEGIPLNKGHQRRKRIDTMTLLWGWVGSAWVNTNICDVASLGIFKNEVTSAKSYLKSQKVKLTTKKS